MATIFAQNKELEHVLKEPRAPERGDARGRRQLPNVSAEDDVAIPELMQAVTTSTKTEFHIEWYFLEHGQKSIHKDAIGHHRLVNDQSTRPKSQHTVRVFVYLGDALSVKQTKRVQRLA